MELARILAGHVSSQMLRAAYRAAVAEAPEALRVCRLVGDRDGELAVVAQGTQSLALLGHADDAIAAADVILAGLGSRQRRGDVAPRDRRRQRAGRVVVRRPVRGCRGLRIAESPDTPMSWTSSARGAHGSMRSRPTQSSPSAGGLRPRRGLIGSPSPSSSSGTSPGATRPSGCCSMARAGSDRRFREALRTCTGPTSLHAAATSSLSRLLGSGKAT